jgi:N-acetylglucosaminyldiphosphoundecaprenol N-acetyl-beta-D-mannosaminyltransferase
MPFKFRETDLYKGSLLSLQKEKLLINTINAHSYNTAQNDSLFREALLKSDVLISDGISVVWAYNWLTGKKVKKIAGEDLFYYEIERSQQKKGKCFFLGSNSNTLKKVTERLEKEYPDVIAETYAPPFEQDFSADENNAMLSAINSFQPDVLFVGMTAPKQEKWAFKNFDYIKAGHVCCIGAVFDFYAGTKKRAPRWMIKIGMEWLFRLIQEPRRMWKRYLIGNIKFIWTVMMEKMRNS